jgi:hypothetical protein
MSRPRKIKTERMDSRSDASFFRQNEIDRLRVDQFNDEPLACVLAPVLLNRATDAEREFVGNLFAEVARTCTPEQLAAFFARVLKLKANVEQPHRNAYAYFGYARFIEETGREPSKPELKAYLLARPEVFKGMPSNGADAKKQWTRLWQDCQLDQLSNG